MEFALQFGRTELSFSRELLKYLHDYPWPGNVRELKHFVERAVALSEDKVIGMDAVPKSVAPAPNGEHLAKNGGNYNGLVNKYRRQLVVEALEMSGNNKIQTAQILGISKSYLFKLIKQLAVPN